MHVAFGLLTLLPGRVGGSETNVRGLLGQFARGNGPERVTVLANRHVMAEYGDFERGPVTLHDFRGYRPGEGTLARAAAMSFALAFPWVARGGMPPGVDVLHHPVTVPIPRAPVPTVTTLLDLQHLEQPENFSRAERALRRVAYDGAARHAHLVVTISEHSRAGIVERLGVPAERVEVVPLGIDRGRFSPEPAAADADVRERLGLPERFVFYPANLWPHKNHAVLVDALAALEDRHLHLVLSGRGMGRLPELLEAARRAGVADRVHHVGYLDGAAVPSVLRAAQALVFPSSFEGFGAPIVEAMASGLPVACADAAALPEVAGGAAVLFDPRSPEDVARGIGEALSRSELLRKAGLRRALEFSWATAAERHRAIYARAAELPAPAT